MADYLSNLVDRFNQSETAVRARPISLFEPHMNFDLSAWNLAGLPNPETQNTVEPSSDLAVHGTRTDSPQQSATSAQTHKSRSEIKPRHHSVPTEQQKSAAAMPTSVPPAQLGYLVVQPRFQANQPVLEPSHPEIITATQAERPRLEPERGANLEEGTPPRGGPAAPRQEKTSQKPAPKNIIRPHLREAAESPGSTLFNPQIATKNDSSPTEPVINITIGSVEVVAVPPPGSTKTKKNDRPSPVISLDEYLKNRDQERQP